MLNKIKYMVKVLKLRGLPFFWVYFRESIWFDLRFGTSTFSRVPKEEQNLTENAASEQENGLLYVASFTSVTQRTTELARDLLGSEKFKTAQFFDLGCGKGKALLVYATSFGPDVGYPAIGIEYDPFLADLARQNATKLGLGEHQLKVITDSATNVRSYAQTRTAIVYLYNSFQGETLRTTLSNLRGLPHVLIYVDPEEKDWLPEYDYKIVHENHGRYNADTWLVATSGLGEVASL